MTAGQLPGSRSALAGPVPGGRLLGRTLVRPSTAAWIGLVVVTVFFAVAAPALVSAGGLAGVLDSASLLGIGALAVGLLLIAGHIDLSIGMVAASSSLLTGLLVAEAGWGIWPALAVSLAASLVVGLLNGWLVVRTGLPSFLVTLAAHLVLQGTSLALTRAIAGTTVLQNLDEAPGWSSARTVFQSTAEWGEGVFSISIVWWLGLTAWAAWLLWRTPFGNGVLAVGGARRAARELGVPVRRTTLTLFCCTAAAGWLIGTLVLVRLGTAEGGSTLMPSIDFLVAAVIGGCLLTGGYGSAVGAAVGALIYAVAQFGITLAGWDSLWFQAFLGVLLIVALLASGVVRSRLREVPRS
ncbi:ABC transporter permease [Trujillonella endophytica]|uniref:Xylose transport system permease protein XylH n=1 Tax=Trujillonella endophytica TaxID=673521 RepID=A0A1H8UGH7_9ACTN|nr:ABC transporter permease [Trujillella endophytica]SEP02295.1 monosaccharide ABC transporter membrane protein, CUT2 family [Trujillella endophytica]